MFVNHSELLWMLRQVDGQRVNREKLLRKFTNHGISSLLPYFDGIEALFDSSGDKHSVFNNVIRALEARINHKVDAADLRPEELTYQSAEQFLCKILIETLSREASSSLETGARVRIKLESKASFAKPGSEGFIIEKLSDTAKVKLYSSAGRYAVDSLSLELPASELEVLPVATLLERHQDFEGIARYFFNDSMLRAMKARIDSSVYSFAANLGIQFLVDEGYVRVSGDEFIGVPSRIFSVLAPKLDATYQDASLFSSHSLSSPPSERKPHVLRLELTTGCDYNKCTFCSEYSDLSPVTKSLEQFKEHVDRVADSIGAEIARIQRLFIGSGNSLGVDTGLLLKSLTYAGDIFNPQRISLYGRTTSILEKSVAELKLLKEAGLCMLYWGLESGSDEVLSYVCKDCTHDDMIEAANRLSAADIETSAMLMPGVGGLKYAEKHVAGTLDLLHSIDLNYLTLLAVNPDTDSPYEKIMQAETDNRHLTPEEVNAQVYQLLAGLEPTGLQIGMFTEEVDQVSSNTMRFNYQFTDSNKELLLRDFWS